MRRRRDAKQDHFFDTVGNAIARTRVAAGISQPKLAEMVGVTLTTIQNAEYGLSCSLYLFGLIAEKLDCNINDLMPLDAIR